MRLVDPAEETQEDVGIADLLDDRTGLGRLQDEVQPVHCRQSDTHRPERIVRGIHAEIELELSLRIARVVQDHGLEDAGVPSPDGRGRSRGPMLRWLRLVSREPIAEREI